MDAGPLAVAACALLILFAAHPGLAGVLIILAASGLCTCYQLAANASFVKATPPDQRSQAFGVEQSGVSTWARAWSSCSQARPPSDSPPTP